MVKMEPEKEPERREEPRHYSSYSPQSDSTGGEVGDSWYRRFAVVLGGVSLGAAGYLAWNVPIDTIPKGLVFSGLFGFGLAGLANLFSGDAEFSLGKTLKLTGYLAVFIFLIVLTLRSMGLITRDDLGYLYDLFHTFVA